MQIVESQGTQLLNIEVTSQKGSTKEKTWLKILTLRKIYTFFIKNVRMFKHLIKILKVDQHKLCFLTKI